MAIPTLLCLGLAACAVPGYRPVTATQSTGEQSCPTAISMPQHITATGKPFFPVAQHCDGYAQWCAAHGGRLVPNMSRTESLANGNVRAWDTCEGAT